MGRWGEYEHRYLPDVVSKAAEESSEEQLTITDNLDTAPRNLDLEHPEIKRMQEHFAAYIQNLFSILVVYQYALFNLMAEHPEILFHLDFNFTDFVEKLFDEELIINPSLDKIFHANPELSKKLGELKYNLKPKLQELGLNLSHLCVNAQQMQAAAMPEFVPKVMMRSLTIGRVGAGKTHFNDTWIKQFASSAYRQVTGLPNEQISVKYPGGVKVEKGHAFHSNIPFEHYIKQAMGLDVSVELGNFMNLINYATTTLCREVWMNLVYASLGVQGRSFAMPEMHTENTLAIVFSAAGMVIPDEILKLTYMMPCIPERLVVIDPPDDRLIQQRFHNYRPKRDQVIERDGYFGCNLQKFIEHHKKMFGEESIIYVRNDEDAVTAASKLSAELATSELDSLVKLFERLVANAINDMQQLTEERDFSAAKLNQYDYNYLLQTLSIVTTQIGAFPKEFFARLDAKTTGELNNLLKLASKLVESKYFEVLVLVDSSTLEGFIASLDISVAMKLFLINGSLPEFEKEEDVEEFVEEFGNAVEQVKTQFNGQKTSPLTDPGKITKVISLLSLLQKKTVELRSGLRRLTSTEPKQSLEIVKAFVQLFKKDAAQILKNHTNQVTIEQILGLAHNLVRIEEKLNVQNALENVQEN